jgi:hypothetical protein
MPTTTRLSSTSMVSSTSARNSPVPSGHKHASRPLGGRQPRGLASG